MTLYFLINDDKKEFIIGQRINVDPEYDERLYKILQNKILTRAFDIPERIAVSFEELTIEQKKQLIEDYNLTGYKENYMLERTLYNPGI